MILVTGANGFVGQAVVESLCNAKEPVRVCIRDGQKLIDEKLSAFYIKDLSEEINWQSALQDVDVIIHLAARVHVMAENVSNPLEEYRQINTKATLSLANQAVEMGVKRFVFLSSIKVNGEETIAGSRFTDEVSAPPDDDYGLSKYEAEQGLLKLAKKTEMEVVVIRPPLVYGPGVRANFSLLMRWVDKGVPLPLGRVNNYRSLVGLDNLVNFIICCAKHPAAKNEVFLISDGEDVSTTELIRKIAAAFDKTPLLLPIPVACMEYLAKLFGKSGVASRLFGSLQVDNSKTRELLNWQPVKSMDEQLKKTVKAYQHEKSV